MNEPTHEIEAYLSGEPTAEDLRVLEAWLKADPVNAKAFMQALHFRELVGERIRERGNDTADVLAELAQLEAMAQTVTVPLDDGVNTKHAAVDTDANALSGHDYLAAVSYLLRHGLPARAVALAAIAAMILIALLLVAPWGDGPVDTTTPAAPDTAQQDPPDNTTHVATLSAQHDATWAEGALAPGSQLRAGTRLTLTAGFAEITTERGAIAILEAPATVELLDNNNALRLHAGKLVGICETESSKGFVVRTPNMDITDLGTRFGVVVQKQGNTLAQVFDGKVVVTPKTQSGIAAEPIELVGGEAHAVDTAGQAIAPQRFEADAFTSLRLAGSGIVSLTGEADLAPRPIADSDTAAAQKGRVTLYQELRGHRLASAIGLTFATPGRYNDFKETRSSVPAGTVIRTYILWHPSSGDEKLTRGSVTFEGEVLGAVANERDWQAFVDATPSAAEQVCKSGRHAALESVPAGSGNPNEQFTLSDDRKTLQFQFRSQGGDALRVIVREPAGDQP